MLVIPSPLPPQVQQSIANTLVPLASSIKNDADDIIKSLLEKVSL